MTYNRSETLVTGARSSNFGMPGSRQAPSSVSLSGTTAWERETLLYLLQEGKGICAVGTTKPTALILLKAQYVYIFQEVALRS